MARTASSYIRTNGAALTRAVDVLSWNNVLGRPTTLTVYTRFVELGNLTSTGEKIVWHWGLSNSSFPYLRLETATGTVYRVILSGSRTSVNAALAVAPTIGDVVEIRVALTVSGFNGTAVIGQSINGATETTATTTAVEMGTAWSGPIVFAGSVGGTAAGFLGLRNLLAVRGAQTLATMRRLAGT